MRYKMKFLFSLAALLFACSTPLTSFSASAETFQAHKPTFGLYCKDDGVIADGSIRYTIDENGDAMQNSEYRIGGISKGSELLIPFLSAPCGLPQINISIGGKAVTGKVRYGEKVYGCKNYHIKSGSFYPSEIEERLTGTLYTVTAESERFTLNFEKTENQAYIYDFTDSFYVQTGNNKYAYTVNNAQKNSVYKIFVFNGDFAKIGSTAKLKKETLTVKDYIDRNFLENQKYYIASGNVSVEFFYALANQALNNKTGYNYADFFFNSILQQYINAYQIEVESNSPCTVNYSMLVEVQKTSSFKPPIYIIEQTSTGIIPLKF